MLFKRSAGVDVAGLESGERVLASATGPDGQVAATDRRLIWPAGSIRWFEVERASWNSDDEVLDVVPVRASDHAARYRVAITEPGRLVDVVREQVTGSVVISRHVPLAGTRGVRVSGRRTPDGGLVWQAVLDAGIDVDDAETRAQLDTVIAQIRGEVEL
ncbi:hypothetical protein [Phytoactinopolyspora limicola]|uniref:hypothetical protein n=1 Tax=Phytoactinopolyspora limicola TaxID=2715536 RepID=UPI0014089D65|nr:hypothetical protein [Phytoactinopolyspora limicola]